MHAPNPARAFSLLELVVVIAILGVVASIAAPRLASASGNAIDASIRANIAQLEHAIEYYAAEHDNRTPAEEPDGKPIDDESLFIKRLLIPTKVTGEFDERFPLGPYLRDIPANPANGRRRIRIDGDPAGADTHGWRFDSALRMIEPDDPEQADKLRKAAELLGGTAVQAEPAK